MKILKNDAIGQSDDTCNTIFPNEIADIDFWKLYF